MNRILLILLALATRIVVAQESFDQLKAVYSGTVSYNATTQAVTFETSGAINFSNKVTNWADPYNNKTLQAAEWIWNVPTRNNFV